MATQTTTQREQAGKKAAATRKRNAANRSAAATRRSARQTGRTAQRSAQETTRSASGVGRQAKTTARLGTRTLEREFDFATTRLEALALNARRGVAIQVGVALEARDTIARTAEFAVRAASRRRTLTRLERRGERALGWARSRRRR